MVFSDFIPSGTTVAVAAGISATLAVVYISARSKDEAASSTPSRDEVSKVIKKSAQSDLAALLLPRSFLDRTPPKGHTLCETPAPLYHCGPWHELVRSCSAYLIPPASNAAAPAPPGNSNWLFGPVGSIISDVSKPYARVAVVVCSMQSLSSISRK